MCMIIREKRACRRVHISKLQVVLDQQLSEKALYTHTAKYLKRAEVVYLLGKTMLLAVAFSEKGYVVIIL